jgi:uncharacterized protein (DUF58 family)
LIRKITSRFDLFLQPRLWWLLGVVWALFVLSYPFSIVLPVAWVALTTLVFFALADLLILFLPNNPVSIARSTGEKWSLGDKNKVTLKLVNNTVLPWRCQIIDELPVELQERKFYLYLFLKPLQQEECSYVVLPNKRGLYEFGVMRVILRTPLGILGRRVSAEADTKVAVYPSIVQMKKYGLHTVSKLARFYGVKRLRRIGMSYEFEQIKEYVIGDDIRHINWKATGKFGGGLKTNHFTEEKAQPVYVVLDKSRPMNLAFDGMTLLDYAVNAGLVIANTALYKGDRAGLISFSDRLGSAIRAENSPGQMKRIIDALYAEKYRTTEADYEFLFNAVKRISSGRSLLFLFTNFESITAMQRVLPVLRKMNKLHLLVVVFFTNAEIENYAYEPSQNLEEVYSRMVARQMVADKRQMSIELANHGIQSVVCQPSELSISVLNRYLELKAKGMI